MQEILMTPDVCMQFLVWSYFYHDVMPEKNVSYKEFGKFGAPDKPCGVGCADVNPKLLLNDT